MQVAREQCVAAFAKRAQLASLMVLGWVSLAVAADKVAELNDDFLEYLGSLEGSDESWLDFANDGLVQDARRDSTQPALTTRDRKAVINASSSSAASVTTKAVSTMTGKADK